MGNLFAKKQRGKEEIVRNVISFPKSVEMGFVQGGDLIFIQDNTLLDGYTKVNT